MTLRTFFPSTRGFPFVAVFALSACVATVEERPARYVYVAGPPPPPLVEARGDPRAPGMIWVGGYWHWNGVQYVWLPGHWEAPPAGYVWVAPRYETYHGRYIYRGGRWEMGGRASEPVPGATPAAPAGTSVAPPVAPAAPAVPAAATTSAPSADAPR